MGIFSRKPNIEKLKEKKDVDGLIKALDHKDWDVAMSAREPLVQIIAESRIARDVETIRHIYREGYDDIVVRAEAIRALGVVKDKWAIELLIKSLHDPIYDFSHIEVVMALGKIKDERAVKPLIEVFRKEDIENSEDNSLHNEVIKALAKMKKAAVWPLIEALRDVDKNVRRCAAETLGKIKDERATEPLVRTLRDKNGEVREAAAEALEALGKIKDEKAVELLVEGRRKDIRQGEIYGGGRLSEIVGSRKAFELLTDDLLKAKNDVVRENVILALGDIVEGSIAAVGDGDLTDISGEFKGEKRVVEPLIECIERKSEALIRPGEVAMILGEIGDRRAVEPLIKYLEERAYGYLEVQLTIIALAKLGDGRAIKPLQRILKNPEKAIHWGGGGDEVYFEAQMVTIKELTRQALERIRRRAQDVDRN